MPLPCANKAVLPYRTPVFRENGLTSSSSRCIPAGCCQSYPTSAELSQNSNRFVIWFNSPKRQTVEIFGNSIKLFPIGYSSIMQRPICVANVNSSLCLWRRWGTIVRKATMILCVGMVEAKGPPDPPLFAHHFFYSWVRLVRSNVQMQGTP